MSSNEAALIDHYGNLGLTKNPDGSITRRTALLPSSPPSTDPELPVLSKDVPINKTNNTWARLYLPRPETETGPTQKLPLIVCFHGGGFVVGSADSTMFQKFLFDISTQIPAVIVSVEYRLAPEHRLPAAYDDCTEALHWIKTTDDEWLTKYADLSNCFLMGSSAGGNIAYRVGLRAASSVDDLAPVEIRGLILHQPFFGVVQRTGSELRLFNDQTFPVASADVMWELGLPIGADRDHGYSNPTVGIELEVLEKVKDLRWRVLVTGSDGDPLVDRQVELAKMLEGKGLNVIGVFREGGTHGYEFWEEENANIFYGDLKNFVLSSL